MISTERETQIWRELAEEFGILFEAHYVLDEAGVRYTFLGRLPQFGSKLGMLLMLPYDHAAASAASRNGFGYSSVEMTHAANRESVVEMLEDWGWTAEGTPPQWYREA